MGRSSATPATGIFTWESSIIPTTLTRERALARPTMLLSFVRLSSGAQRRGSTA
jgi:hypothetical protein